MKQIKKHQVIILSLVMIIFFLSSLSYLIFIEGGEINYPRINDYDYNITNREETLGKYVEVLGYFTTYGCDINGLTSVEGIHLEFTITKGACSGKYFLAYQYRLQGLMAWGKDVLYFEPHNIERYSGN